MDDYCSIEQWVEKEENEVGCPGFLVEFGGNF